METNVSSNRIDHATINFLISYINEWHKRVGNADDRPPSIYKELLKDKILDPDFSWEKNAIIARSKVKPVMSIIFENLIKDYFEKDQSILEIGSGNLKDNQSYLSAFFNERNWMFSDIHALSRTHRTNPHYLTLNLTDDTTLNIAEHSFDRIIGCNVLDTIPYSDFPKIFKKLKLLLKPRQLFLHVADLNFYCNAFLDACDDPKFVLLPSAVSSRKIGRILRSRYNEVIENSESKLSKQEFNFLKQWGKQDTRIQGAILGDAILIPVNLTSFHKRIKELFGDELEFLVLQNVFETHLKEAAGANGWKVIECGFRSEAKDFEKENPADPTNYFELNQGQLLGGIVQSIPEGTLRMKAKLHVFAAST